MQFTYIASSQILHDCKPTVTYLSGSYLSTTAKLGTELGTRMSNCQPFEIEDESNPKTRLHFTL